MGDDPREGSSTSFLGPESQSVINQSDNTFAWRMMGEQSSQWLSASVFPSTTGCGSAVLVAHRKPCVHPGLAPWAVSVRPVPWHLLAFKNPAQEIARWVHKALEPDAPVDALLAVAAEEPEPEIPRAVGDALNARLFEQAAAAQFLPLLRRFASPRPGAGAPRLSLSRQYPTLDLNGPLANQIMASVHQEWSPATRGLLGLVCEWVRDDALTVLPTQSRAGRTPLHALLATFGGRPGENDEDGDQGSEGGDQGSESSVPGSVPGSVPYMATPTPTPVVSVADPPEACVELLRGHPVPSVRAREPVPVPTAFDLLREVLLTAAAREADLLHAARGAMRGDAEALGQAEALERVWAGGLADRAGQTLWHSGAASRDNLTWHSLLRHEVGFAGGMAFAPDSLGVSAADMLADRFTTVSNLIKPNPGDQPGDAASLEQVLAATDAGMLPESRSGATKALDARVSLLAAATAACVGGLPPNGKAATTSNPRAPGSAACRAWLARRCCHVAADPDVGSGAWWVAVDRVQAACPLVSTARVAGRMAWMRPLELLQQAAAHAPWGAACPRDRARLLDEALAAAWNDEVNALDGVAVELSPAIERVVVDEDRRQLPRFNASAVEYGRAGWQALGSPEGRREAAGLLEALEARFGVCSGAVVQLDAAKLEAAERGREAAGGNGGRMPSALLGRLLLQLGVPVLVRGAANETWMREMTLQAFVARLGSRRFRIGTTAFSVANAPEIPIWAVPLLSARDVPAQTDLVLRGIASDAAAGVPPGDALQRALARAQGQPVQAACPGGGGVVPPGASNSSTVGAGAVDGGETAAGDCGSAAQREAVLRMLEPVRRALHRHSNTSQPFGVESLGISGTNRHWLWTPNTQPVFTRSDWTHAVKPSVLDLNDVGGYDAQLFGGGPLSGTNAHLHGAAVNVLAAGVKRWFLWPPSQTVYTAEPSRHLARRLATQPAAQDSPSTAGAELEGEAPLRPDGAVDPVAQCTQYAGDVLMLPRAWGHGILNVVGNIGLGLETRLHPHGMLRAVLDRFTESEWAFLLKADAIHNFNDL